MAIIGHLNALYDCKFAIICDTWQWLSTAVFTCLLSIYMLW